MEINQKEIGAALELVTMSEIEKRYSKEGYKVIRNYDFRGHKVDLYAENNDNKFIFEFKSRPIYGKERQILEIIRQEAKKEGIHFRIVIVPMPSNKKIQVDGIEKTLLHQFQHSPVRELIQLSFKTEVEDVDEIIINDIELQSSGIIKIQGKGVIFLKLNFDIKEKESILTSIPFDFTGDWIYEKEALKFLKFEDIKFHINPNN